MQFIDTEEWWMVYGFDGELVAEYKVNGVFDGQNAPAPTSPVKEYIYREGQVLVVSEQGNAEGRKLQWLVHDQLGTPRMVFDTSGKLHDDPATTNVVEGVRRHDYLPFGEENVYNAAGGSRTAANGYVADGVRQQFAGYERDNETGLDFAQARYYSNVQGRFTSPDPYLPSADVKEPQSWNRYSYGINNPLKYVDPTGLDYEHLQGRQKELIDEWAKRQNAANKTNATAQQLYDGLSESQRTTYESVSHALMNTQLTDKEGKSLGTALDLVQSVDKIAGEIKGARGDEQFRLYVTLKEDAPGTLQQSREFSGPSRNKGFHEGFPDYFQQKGGAPSAQASMRDLRTFASSDRGGDLDVDYRSKRIAGLFNGHLTAANSDVRAGNNYQKHVGRWPGLTNWWNKKGK